VNPRLGEEQRRQGWSNPWKGGVKEHQWLVGASGREGTRDRAHLMMNHSKTIPKTPMGLRYGLRSCLLSDLTVKIQQRAAVPARRLLGETAGCKRHRDMEGAAV
jgi:hypothetical protein